MLTDRIFWDLSRDEYADYVELATITDSTIQYYDINTSVISKKLGDAGYSEEFGWVKFKIDLISGTPSGSLYSYAPTFYDYYLNHDNIKE